jgi:mRNA interferase HicA
MRLIPVAPKKLIKLLGLIGYFPVRQKGSHVILENKGTRKITVVPIHNRDVGVGLLGLILREAGLSKEEYFRLLEKV